MSFYRINQSVRYYLLSLLILSIATGIQIVLLPWLIVDHFMLGSVWVGWLQTALLLPNLLFLMIGGAVADYLRNMNYLPRIIAINGILHVSMVVFIRQDILSISLLLVYASFLGLSNAFIQPGREYLLKQFCRQKLQKLIAKSSLCVYGGQVIGALMASMMGVVPIHSLFLLQALLVVVAVILLRQMTKNQHLTPNREGDSPVRLSLVKGFKDIRSSPALLSLVTIVGFSGFFHMGIFIVSIPVLVQDVYLKDADFYGALQAVFLAGTLIASVVVVYRNGLNAPGKRIAFNLLYGGVILLALGAGPTITGLFILIFVWGFIVGISANMGRTILQLLAPPDSRGQVIAIYQLSLFGCAPLGAALGGYIISWWGVLPVLVGSGLCSFLMFMLILPANSLWNIEPKE